MGSPKVSLPTLMTLLVEHLRMIFLSGSKVLSITFDSNFTIADFDYFCKVNSITKTVLNYTKALENK